MESQVKYPDGEYVKHGDVYDWRWFEVKEPEVVVPEPEPEPEPEPVRVSRTVKKGE